MGKKIEKYITEARKIIDEEILAEQANEDGSFGQFANPAACAIAELDRALSALKEQPKCETCGGSGEKLIRTTFHGHRLVEPCPNCKGTGVSPDCQQPKDEAAKFFKETAEQPKANKEFVEVRDIILDSQRTHREWLQYLQVAPETKIEPKLLQAIGGTEHHKRCIERYAVVLKFLDSQQVEQPPVGEFTRQIRNQQDVWDNLPDDSITIWLAKRLGEVCDKLDSTEELYAAATKALNSQIEINNQLKAEFAEAKERIEEVEETLEMKSYDLLISNYYSTSRGDPETKSVSVCSICGQRPHKKECKYGKALKAEKGE